MSKEQRVTRSLRPSRQSGVAIAIVILLFTDFTMLYLRQGPEPVSAEVLLDDLRRQDDGHDDTATEHQTTADGGAVATTGDPNGDTAPLLDEPQSPTPTGNPPAPKTTPPPSGPTEAPVKAAAGVYEYRTNGYEHAAAMGGSRHDYPATTYMSLRHTACGITLRWQPLKERWDETQLCGDSTQTEIRVFTMYHEFFQQGKTDEYRCAPGAAKVYDRAAPVGSTWSAACEGAGGGFTMDVTVVGIEFLPLQGRQVEAVHMHYDGKIRGDSHGTQVQDRWFDRTTGLLLQIHTEVDARTKTPIGETDYTERYRLDVVSATPQT